MTFSQLVRSEFSGWKASELIYLTSLTAIALGVSIYMKDSFIATASSVIGVLSVIISGKGKVMYYPLYLVFSLLYAWISWQGSYYGQSILYAFFLSPMCIYGFINWMRNLNLEKAEIRKRSLTWKQRLILAVIVVAVIAVLALILEYFGDAKPLKDASSTTLIITAFMLTLFRYVENWWIWVASNAINTTLWIANLSISEESNYAQIVMFAIFLLNSVVALVKWQKSLASQQD